MRVPLSWLREHADLPPDVDGRGLAARLVAAGLEVERVEEVGAGLSGPLVVGRVVAFTEETHSNGKTVRWCTVDAGDGDPRGIVCGARNFEVDDRVVVALPGAVLAGGFAITARRTYGHVSAGMICSARELLVGDDHAGILVLRPDEAAVGADAGALLGAHDAVLDIAVTPDRGYCLSVRGVAREAATAYGVPYADPLAGVDPGAALPGPPTHIEAAERCDRFTARTVNGLDPGARSPRWLQRRVQLGGMRPISLPVDVTNYVMLLTGQPMHAFDATKLSGGIVVRRARSGERLGTLDGANRVLDPDDVVVADGSGAVALAGVMGGAATEIDPHTTDLVLEAAHWEPSSIARSVRRHKLPSEASRRFERGVDPEAAGAALRLAADLLVRYGGAQVEQGVTVAGSSASPAVIDLPPELPSRLGGRRYEAAAVRARLRDVGCNLEPDGELLRVTVPSWRPDLRQPADLVEEVLRLEGYDTIPVTLPVAPAGRGHTTAQRRHRRVGQTLAGAGYVETPCYPFISAAVLDDLGVPVEDRRRRLVPLANPPSDAEPYLRTTLLPGLLATARRNVGRGSGDLALFETGLVFRARPGAALPAPRLPVDRRPSDHELAALDAALPEQPRHLAVVLAGDLEPGGWWGGTRPATWADAISAVRRAAGSVGADVEVRAATEAPWHPGRCAAVLLDEHVVGHAGELHPRVVAALDLPPRTCAAEVDLDRILTAGVDVVAAPRISTFPVATQDVALIVDSAVPAVAVEEALRAGAGPLLESLRLFDVYAGTQVGAGRRSLAYALRFRAPDRTLTVEETTAARTAAVAEAGRRTGAVARGG